MHPCPPRCGAPVSLDVPRGMPAVAVHPRSLRPGRIGSLGAIDSFLHGHLAVVAAK